MGNCVNSICSLHNDQIGVVEISTSLTIYKKDFD